MNSNIIIKILETIGGAAIDSLDLFEAFLNAGYGASGKKMECEFLKLKQKRGKEILKKEIQNQTNYRYSKFIYKLRKDNLIKESKKDNGKFFTLTQKGKEKLFLLKKKFNKKMPEIAYSNFKEKSDKFIIIIFDIPEVERKKRNWLRSVLKNLEFKMIQKSVWIGKTKIPKEFMADLAKINLLNYVEIFEISKRGSLEKLD